MVLRIPETGFQLESSEKTADNLPLQAFAITLSDNVIEDLIQCVQDGEDIRLSLGNVPSFLYGQEVHKIPKATEIPDLELYLTDPSDSAQHAQRFPHPTMTLFSNPALSWTPRMAVGRNSKITGRAPRMNPDTLEKLRRDMAIQQKANKEHAARIASISNAGAKRTAPKTKNNKLMPSKGGAMAGAIGRSAPASPALSGILSPALGPTLSSAEQASKEKARDLRAPIVHQLAMGPMSLEALRSKWPGQDSDFKPALDKTAEYDSARQQYQLKRTYWKELDVFKYNYESADERQTAIDNAIRMYDRMRMGASEPVWDRLLPKEERGKGKCLSKLLATIAIQTAAKTPQIKVNDGDESSGSRDRDGSPSSTDSKKVAKKASTPMSRQSSQAKKPAPAKKIERKWIGKETTPKPTALKPSPVKAGSKPAASGGKYKSKEFISDSDSSSEEAPLAKTVARAKDRENEKERERQREREMQREREREREKEKEKEKEREAAREKLERQKNKEKEAAGAAAAKPKPKPAVHKQVTAPQTVSRPTTQKRSREEADDDSSSSSSTPLNKRTNREREPKASARVHSTTSNKRPPSDSSSQTSSRSTHSSSNTYANTGYTSKNKNTSPVKSSPLASSPPTNASDLDHQHQHQHTTVDERRHERERDHSRDRSVTVANGTSIHVAKKRKLEADGDAIDNVPSAGSEKKRQRLSADVLNDARLFKKFYDAYQRLHYELSGGGFSPEVYQDKYEELLKKRSRLENLKKSIYAQIPRDCY